MDHKQDTKDRKRIWENKRYGRKMSNKDYYGPGGAGGYGQPQNTYYTNGPSSIGVPAQAYGAPPPVNDNRPVSISPFFPSLPPPIWPWKMLIEDRRWPTPPKPAWDSTKTPPPLLTTHRRSLIITNKRRFMLLRDQG